MSKIKVQDATRDLSAKASSMLSRVSALRKRAEEKAGALRKISNGFAAENVKIAEQEQKAAARRKYEGDAQFMSAYSSDRVPKIPEKSEPIASAEVPAETPAVQEQKPVRGQQDRPARPERGQQQRPARPAQPGQPAQGRPADGQQRFGRPVQPGQVAAQGRPADGQQRFGRPVQSGQGAAQGRPADGQQRFGRPAQPGQRPQGGAFNRDGQRPQGGARPAGGGYGAGGAGRQRSKMPDLAPVVEKDRVSNYDPNKKQYVRQNDPERNSAKNKQQGNGRRTNSANLMGGYDDEFMRGRKKKKGAAKKTTIEPMKIEHAVMTAENITVRDLSERLGKPSGELIKKLIGMGKFVAINDILDFETAALVAAEYDIELEQKLAETAEEALEKEDVADREEDLVHRPPVVTIMGHVDHGKTSLLDYIRKTKVTASEAGGITQHIGAYTVNLNDQQITFLDTPGHEAFTSMRLRGAQATDIAVLVVAADDGVMPQTIEAISHAKAANVQIIVAINKMDKVGADPERIKQQLTEYELVCEEWGGSTPMVPVSAVTGDGVDELLETILLVAEVEDYKANPNRKARGIIIEARLDKGRGPVATVLVKNGTLNLRDDIVSGTAYGRVRAMVNERGERVTSAGPSCPVEVIGFNDVPEAGDILTAVDDDALSRQVAQERKDKLRSALIVEKQKTTLDDLFSQISEGQVKDLNVIIKADVQGSVEAVRQSLERLSNDEVRVRTIHGAVGAINESDVMLANTSNAIIVGFNVRPDSNARSMAEREKIDIRLYRVIYQAIEEIQMAMKGMLAPKFKEVLLGHAAVRQTYRITGVGMIAGSYVTDGKITRNAQIRLLRDNVVIHEGKIDSLRRFKDDVKEVNTGYECGIGIAGYNDIKDNDVIECFVMEEIER